MKTKKKYTRKQIVRTISFVIIGCILFYYFYNLFLNSTSAGYKTQVATNASLSDGVAVKGIAVREEVKISGSKTQNVNYMVQSGTKVSKKSPIAKAYPTAKDITVINQIEELNEQIAALENLQTKASSSSANQEGISRPVYDSINKLNNTLDSGSLNQLPSSKQNLSNELNTRDKKLGVVMDYTEKINKLKSQRSELQKSVKQPSQTLYAPESGYFVSYTDGFEDVITPKNIGSYDVKKLTDLLESKTVNTDYKVVGKMIIDYRWQYVCIIDSKSAEDYETGMKMTLDFPTEDVSRIPVTISKVKREGDQALLVLDADYLTADIAAIRNQEAELSFTHYEGLRVPSSALRIQDGQKGVYVLELGEPVFKKINILYQNDKYMIIEMNTGTTAEEKEYLKLYDEVIINS